MATLPKGWIAVCEDESIFVYDSVVRAVWARKGSRPIVLKTGSHRKTCVFGALSLDGRQLFRQTQEIDHQEFIRFLNTLKRKFKKILLFIDRAPWHGFGQRGAEEVKHYFAKNKKCIMVVHFPKVSPEFNPVEECWRQTKDSVLGSTFYPTFEEMKAALAQHLRTKRFKLNMAKYLCQ